MNMQYFHAKVSKGLLASDGIRGAGKLKFLSRINETETTLRLEKVFYDNLKFLIYRNTLFC